MKIAQFNLKSLIFVFVILMTTGCSDWWSDPSKPEIKPNPAYKENFSQRYVLTADQASKNQQAAAEKSNESVEYENTISMKLKLIPAGTFIMGSPEWEGGRSTDEGPMHEVKISKSFYMGIYEVTHLQWKSVMNSEPWSVDSDVKKGDNYPITYVSWEDAVEFCEKLSVKEKRTYRLPTEAEWEYACRAGTNSAYYFGHTLRQLGNCVWYHQNTYYAKENYAHEVGQKSPNAWGLYDMVGNVHEWCKDWYSGDYYERSPKVDPGGPISGSGRVLRGGNWLSPKSFCRSAVRGGESPDKSDKCIGFRIVLEVE